MKFALARKSVLRTGGALFAAVALLCAVLAGVGAAALNRTAEDASRRLVMEEAEAVARCAEALFKRADKGLAAVASGLAGDAAFSEEALLAELATSGAAMGVYGCGLFYEGGLARLASGTEFRTANETPLGEGLNLSKERIGGEDMLLLAHPCAEQAAGERIRGIFAAVRFSQLEIPLDDAPGVTLAIAQADGAHVWQASGDAQQDCFRTLARLGAEDGALLEMQQRMSEALEGTIAYSCEGEARYLAYLPLGRHDWYVLVHAGAGALGAAGLIQRQYGIWVLGVLAVTAALLCTGCFLLCRRAARAEYAFLATLSHDLRTPLNSVVGRLELARTEYDEREKCLANITKARASAQELLTRLDSAFGLPASEGASTPKDGMEDELRGISILLAEDNAINAEIAKALLQKRGARITLAENGEEALALFRESPIGAYDVILMDIQMPKMDGIQATQEIRRLDRPDAARIPILAMTANALKEQRAEMFAAGIDECLYKPMDTERVCKSITQRVALGRTSG